MISRMDHEMSMQNMEPDDSIKVDQLHQFRHQENKELEDLKQKMAIGRQQATVSTRNKSPPA